MFVEMNTQEPITSQGVGETSAQVNLLKKVGVGMGSKPSTTENELT